MTYYNNDEDLISMADAEIEKGKPNYIDKLKNTLDREILFFDEDMGRHTSFRCGGKAEVLIIPRNKSELMEALEILDRGLAKYTIIGNGSNVLVKDSGFKGAIIKIGKNFDQLKVNGTEIRVGAGVSLGAVARAAAEGSLTGLEFSSGIPGYMGGAIFMNAGAYGGEMKDVVTEVRVISKDGIEEKILFPRDLKFDYRYSAIQESEQIILGATLSLKKGDKREIEAKMKNLLDERNLKQPVEYPSAGSFFKRPKNNYAGKLVQDAKLKGFEIGGAQVSPKHAGFVINTGAATATDIITLMEEVQKIVFEKFGVRLEPEVRIIGE